MSVFIYEVDAFEKMAKVEGRMWVDQETQRLEQRVGLGYKPGGTFIEALRQFAIYEMDRAAHREDESDWDNAVIYGAGGYHRYVVRMNGEIQFSQHHCCLEDKLTLAIETGFTVY